MNGKLKLLLATAAGLAAFGMWFDGGAEKLAGLLYPQAEQAELAIAGAQLESGQDKERPSSVPLNPVAGLTLDSLSALVERPMFNPGRSPRPAAPEPAPVAVTIEEPAVEAAEPGDQGPNKTDFTLLAVSSSPSERVAALRLNASNEVLYLRQGQPVSSWEVLAVGDREITIGTKDKSITLKLFDAGSDAGNGLSGPGQDEQAAGAGRVIEPPSDPNEVADE